TMTRRSHVELDRMIATTDANRIVPRFERHPCIAFEIFLAGRIELLDEKILNIGTNVRQAPRDALVVTDDDERNSRNGDAYHVHRRADYVRFPPHRRHLDHQMWI